MADSGKNSVTLEFKTEVKQLLDILAHSLYSHREVFVRELISNAADALYKVRFESVRGTEIYDPELPFEINIGLDKDKKILTITDSGIGMTQDELIANIGTIARSGTAEFFKQLADDSKKGGSDLIGKFGVGFYSVFMAGREVQITTRSFQKDAQPILWKSDGGGSYEITPLVNAPRGTKIEIFLRDDAAEFAEKYRIEDVIKKYSNFVPFPIKIDGEPVNKITAIWREPKTAVTKDQYIEFYKFKSNRDDEPLTHLHLSSDAPIQFNALLFIPPTNFEIMGMSEREHGVDLFVRRVLIQSSAKDLVPDYLRFLKGVVDTEDLPLNISRETLQENTVVIKIKSVLVKRVLSHLKEMAEKDPENYEKFWKEYSRIFKEGYSDYANRELIGELLRFNSSHFDQGEALTSLPEYVSRMKDGQKNIYYLSATSREAIERNPHLEIFRKKGIEVLFMYDPIDEFVMSGLGTFKDKTLQSADQAELSEIKKLKDAVESSEASDANPDGPKEKQLEKLCRRFKDILGEKVTEVRLSERLTESPAVLVNPDGSISAQMQKIMQMIHQQTDIPKKILEINGGHPIIRNLFEIYEHDAQDEHLAKSVEQLFYSALLQDGYVADPFKIISGINHLLTDATQLYLEKCKSEASK